MIMPELSESQFRLVKGIVATTFTFFLFSALGWLFYLTYHIQIVVPSEIVALTLMFLPPAIVGGYITKDALIGAKAGTLGNLLNIIIITLVVIILAYW